MNEIKILSLNLRNFKGIKDFTLDINGSDVNVYGENGTGKTTIMDAFLWLLFDKDSANSSNFNIKTLDKLGQPIHGLEHEVIAKLLINGKEIELQKVYKENWVKRKGQLQEELSGHTTDYFINGVPKKRKEYLEYLSNIVKEDNFKILTNPLFFNTSLTWKERRNIILDLEKDIQDEEIYKKDKDLLPLKELLEDKSIDDLKAEMSSRRRKLNEELKSIPHRIDELSRSNEEIDMESLNNKKKELEEHLSQLRNSKGKDHDFIIRRINGSIDMLKSDIKLLERELTEEIREELDQARKDRFEIRSRHQEFESKRSRLQQESTITTKNIELLQAEIEELRGKFADIQASEFKKDSTICPTCSQNLPIDEVDALIKEFEQNKVSQLKDINQIGKSNKEHLEKYMEESDKLQSGLFEVKEEMKTTYFMLEGKNNVVESLEKELENINIEKLPEYKETQEKILNLEAEREKELVGQRNQEDKSSAISNIENQILDINKQLARVDLVKENEKRVEELMARETELAQNIAETERVEFLCDKYVITKSSLLEDKLNSKFDLVKFKLFDVQVNGGISETFVTTVNGIPFEDLNNAMKIQAGLDIITTLSKEYDLIAPIFLDNRESVNKIPNMQAQIINLIVSKHKNLTVKVGE